MLLVAGLQAGPRVANCRAFTTTPTQVESLSQGKLGSLSWSF